MGENTKIIFTSVVFSILAISVLSGFAYIGFNTYSDFRCGGSNYLGLDGNCHAESEGFDRTLNAVTNTCKGTQYLAGDGQCYQIDFNPSEMNVNDSDAVIGNEFQSLSVDSSSVNDTISLTNGSSITIDDNYAPTDSNTDNQTLSVDSSGVNDSISIQGGNSVSIQDDYEANTDAESKCSGDKYLAGNGTCVSDQVNIPTEVFIGKFTISNSASIEVSSVPFQPDMIEFHAQAPVNGYNTDQSGTGNGNTADNFAGSMTGFARDDSGSITQQVISSGGSGNSINAISYYASSSEVVGVRYGDQNGGDIGSNRFSLSSFDSDGFTLSRNEYERNMVVVFKAYKLN